MPKKLLISDANIIIDMEVGGLLDRMFGLKEYEFAVPDVLYETELKEDHPNLIEMGVKTIELQPDAVRDTVSLAARYRKPGRIDLMALALARQEQCALLTGDQKLRDAGNAEGVTVFGTIWLVGEMLRGRILTEQDARIAYDKMKQSDRRLPWAEVEKQIKESG